SWLLKMYPEDDLLLNQLGDDRDHTFWDLPVNDSADYGWGRGGRRPVYPCTGKPQGLFEFKNRSTGLASTAGKYAAAFALGAAALEPGSPWMGQDTARHYQWYPWHNNGHYEIWRATRGPRGPGGPDSAQRRVAEYYARGLGAVARRAGNGFRIGIPFIWCSNNL